MVLRAGIWATHALPHTHALARGTRCARSSPCAAPSSYGCAHARDCTRVCGPSSAPRQSTTGLSGWLPLLGRAWGCPQPEARTPHSVYAYLRAPEHSAPRPWACVFAAVRQHPLSGMDNETGAARGPRSRPPWRPTSPTCATTTATYRRQPVAHTPELASRPRQRAAPGYTRRLATHGAHLEVVGLLRHLRPRRRRRRSSSPSCSGRWRRSMRAPTAAGREHRPAAAAAGAGPCPATGQWTCAGGRRGGSDVDIVVPVEGAGCSSRCRRRGRLPLDIVDQPPRQDGLQVCARAALHLRGEYPQGAAEPLSRRPAMGSQRDRFNRYAAGALLLDARHMRGRLSACGTVQWQGPLRGHGSALVCGPAGGVPPLDERGLVVYRRLGRTC